MKNYEWMLTFLYDGRMFRLSSWFIDSAINSKCSSKFISLLSIFALLSSVAAVPQHVINQNQQQIPFSSSIKSRNGTTTTSNGTIIFNTSHEWLLSTITSSLSETKQNETLNVTEISKNDQKYLPNPARLVVVIIICSLMCILTIVGNLVVILSVLLVRKLQTASNILIVSLAVSDIFVGLFIMPLALVLEITNNNWILGSVMCDIWTSTDVLLCTSSILNFLAISIDRYCIINHPFKYAPMRKVKLLSFMITVVWILSALVSLPPILGWGRPSASLPICQVYDELNYQIFATMLSFYIPLIVVIVIYANIYRTARTAVDNRSSAQMSQFLTHNSSTPNIGQTSAYLAEQQSNGNSCSSPQLFLNVSNSNDDNTSRSVGKFSITSPQEPKSSNLLSPARCLGRRISAQLNSRLSILVTGRNTIFRHAHLPNQKAIRTLGVILGTFIVCWLPFMVYAIIKPLHKHLTNPPRPINAPEWIDSVLLWFGYSSSMLNPLIYSKFNREFRLPFREIICCRCKGLNEKIRRQEYLENLHGENPLQLSVPSHMTTNAKSSGNLQAAV